MNLILLITVTVTTVLALEPNKSPCLLGKDHDFVKKHILLKDLGENKAQWSEYLKDKDLCGREEVQSFIFDTEQNVKEICSPKGEYVSGNLCRSGSKMTVYNVKSSNDCTVKEVTRVEREVVVACDKVGTECIPVHYQAKINVIPKGGPCTK